MEREAQTQIRTSRANDRRTEEARQVVREYIEDQLEILRKLQRYLN